jgi:hypothetical protein
MYSTQWYAEKKKTNKVSASYVPQETRNYKAEEVFWKWYENKAIKTIRRFGFIGGEPFLIDALYECFDKLIEIHDRTSVAGDPVTGKVELCITSNMNTPPAYFEKFLSYIPRLEKHFTIIIQVSGENTGDDLEYIRHGVKWDRWSKNVEYLLANTTVTLNFLPCLSLMSIPRFHLYLEFYKEMCQKYRFMQIHNNIVTGPYEQSPMIAPKEFAQYFDKCIEIMQWVNENNKNQMITHALVTFIDWLKRTQNAISNNPSETEITENAIKFFQYFEDLDRVRRTNLLEVFPELTAFYKAGSNGIKSNNIIPIIAT